MRIFYTDEFVLPLPADHRFPMAKYRRLREQLLELGIAAIDQLEVPTAASDDELRLVHGRDWVERVIAGRLTPTEIRRIGFPWSPALVERARRSVGGTIAAARAALRDGVAVNLAGGTHHAFADHGEGYCVFNDAAVAVRVLRREQAIDRAVIVDCDVHQGNGTAAIFRDDPAVFTLSLHGGGNYPFRKERGDLDVALADGTEDVDYLRALDEAIGSALSQGRPELAIYVSGADPYRRDRLGRLALTRAGLVARDEMVLGRCRLQGVPTAVVMAGGYADDVETIAGIHARTVAVASRASHEWRALRPLVGGRAS